MKKLLITLQLFLLSAVLLCAQETKDYALYFDGGDEVIIEHNSLLNLSNSTEYTIELWFNNTGNRSVYHILGKRQLCGHSALNYQIARDNASQLSFISCSDVISTRQNPVKNEWTHMAVTFKNNLAKVYLNGALNTTTTYNMCGTNAVSLKLGNSGTCSGSQRFIGYMDEVRIWNTARDSNEIAYFHNRPVNPYSPELTAYWSFNEDSLSQTITDITDNNLHGYLGSDTLTKSDDPVRMLSTLELLDDNFDIELTGINGIDSVLLVQDTITPSLTLYNNGLTAQTFDVHLLLDVFYRNTQLVTLEPGESREVYFPEFIPYEAGVFKYKAYINSANDAYNYNDTLASGFSVSVSENDPVVLSITPGKIGFDSPVLITLAGNNLLNNSYVVLRQQTDSIVFSKNEYVGNNSATIKIQHVFKSGDIGAWNMELTDTLGNSYYYKEVFEVEEPEENLMVEIIGRELIRAGRYFDYKVKVVNNGNKTEFLSYLLIDIPLEVNTEINIPGIGWKSNLNKKYIDDTTKSLIVLEIPVLKPSTPLVLDVKIKVSESGEYKIGTTITNLLTKHTDIENMTSSSSLEYCCGVVKSTAISNCEPEDECSGKSPDCITNYPFSFDASADFSQLPRDRVYRIKWQVFGDRRKGFHEGYILNDSIYWSYETRIHNGTEYVDYNGVHAVHIDEVRYWETISFQRLSIKRALPGCATNSDLNTLINNLKNSKKNYRNYTFSAESDMINTLHCSGFTILVNPHLNRWLYNRTKYRDMITGECRYGCEGVLFFKDCFSNHQVDRALNYWSHLNELNPDECNNSSGGPNLIELPGNGEGSDTDFIINTVNSWDPNDKIGPNGSGEERYININSPINYVINFENADSATAPAQEVFLTDTLDLTKFTLSTFVQGNIKIGDSILQVPANKRSYNLTYDMRPEIDVLVDVEAGLDPFSGVASWKFTSLDPLTGELPDDPLLGFLPPNKSAPEGEGYVSFSIYVHDTLNTETRVENEASIYFDYNPPINTPVWYNTIDTTSPTSYLSTDGTVFDTNIVDILINSNDFESGIKDYSVYYSVNNSEYNLYNSFINTGSVLFRGEYGNTYSFYSISRDKVGNIETKTDKPDISIIMEAPQHNQIFDRRMSEIKVFPNPVNNKITIASTSSIENLQVQIYNSSGQLVFNNSFKAFGNKKELDLSQLHHGVYYLKIIYNNTNSVHRIIK